MWQQLPKDIRLQIARHLSVDVRIALGVSPGKLQVPVYLLEALINAKPRLTRYSDCSQVWFNVFQGSTLQSRMLLEHRCDSPKYSFNYLCWSGGNDDPTSAWGSPDNTVYNEIK